MYNNISLEFEILYFVKLLAFNNDEADIFPENDTNMGSQKIIYDDGNKKKMLGSRQDFVSWPDSSHFDVGYNQWKGNDYIITIRFLVCI